MLIGASGYILMTLRYKVSLPLNFVSLTASDVFRVLCLTFSRKPSTYYTLNNWSKCFHDLTYVFSCETHHIVWPLLFICQSQCPLQCLVPHRCSTHTCLIKEYMDKNESVKESLHPKTAMRPSIELGPVSSSLGTFPYYLLTTLSPRRIRLLK